MTANNNSYAAVARAQELILLVKNKKLQEATDFVNDLSSTQRGELALALVAFASQGR